MATDQPLVTIITVVLNNADHIEKCIQSVAAQTYSPIELVVIDGGSTDGTLEVIKRNDHFISHWISEKDSGIYEAMNKGLKKSNGQLFSVLNSDDWLEPDAVALSVRNMLDNNVDFSYGTISYVFGKDRVERKIRPLPKEKIFSNNLQSMPFPHISLFCKREVFEKIGFFDERFRIAGDFDFIIRMLKAGFKGKDCFNLIGSAYAGGISSNPLYLKESRHIVITHGKNFFRAWFDYFVYRAKFELLRFIPLRLVCVLLQIKKSRFR